MIEPLNDRDSFARLASGHRARCGPLRLRFVDASVPTRDAPAATGAQGVRVAYAISRKSGNAVMRNRIRRRLRAALFELERDEPQAFVAGDYLFAANSELSTLPFHDVQELVRRTLSSVARSHGGSASRDR